MEETLRVRGRKLGDGGESLHSVDCFLQHIRLGLREGLRTRAELGGGHFHFDFEAQDYEQEASGKICFTKQVSYYYPSFLPPPPSRLRRFFFVFTFSWNLYTLT